MSLPLTRRVALAGLAASPVLAALPARAQGAPAATIHRHEQTAPFPVNAWLVEGSEGVVAVDATLTVASAAALRDRAAALAKPLRAILLTHPHPDHYAGLSILRDGRDIPILSVGDVARVARRDDAAKDALIGGMFGPDWPGERTFPDTVVAEGEALDFGPGLRFEVLDIGPAESHHDSAFLLDGGPAFAGDLAYGLMHAYMADGHNDAWRRALDRLSAEVAADRPLLIGHGDPVTTGFVNWQRTYLDHFEAAIRASTADTPEALVADVTAAMLDYLPSEELLFLMQLSVEPTARLLGRL